MPDASEEQLLEFIYACPVGLLDCTASGEITMVNPHAMQHLLVLAGDRDPTNFFAVFERHAPELRNLVESFGRPSGRICQGHRIVVDLGSKGPDGREPDGKARVFACTLVKLSPDRFMATLADISKEVALERRLRQADTWFAALLDPINSYATATLTTEGDVRTVNEAFTAQTGVARDQALGKRLAAVLGGGRLDGEHTLEDQLATAAREGWHLVEGWQTREGADRYWCQRLAVVQLDESSAEPSGYSVVLRDVPRRGATTEELRRLLTRDHLTGAVNRMHFGQILDDALVRSERTKQPLSLVMLDLDRFKSVNDTHGHPVGDTLLCEVASTCMTRLPPRATLSRLGGEEFAILLPSHDLGQAGEVAEMLRTAIASIRLPVPGGVLRTTASFGCAWLAETGGSVRAMITLADERLYRAKREGRNRVCCPAPASV